MTADKRKSLLKYADDLRRRLAGQLDKELRLVLEIDLRKTLARIEKG